MKGPYFLVLIVVLVGCQSGKIKRKIAELEEEKHYLVYRADSIDKIMDSLFGANLKDTISVKPFPLGGYSYLTFQDSMGAVLMVERDNNLDRAHRIGKEIRELKKELDK